MLTQEDALETLRELSRGVARLTGFFDKTPVVPETISAEVKQAPPEAAAAAAIPAPAPPAVAEEADLELEKRRIEVKELEARAKQAQANLDEANLSQNALEEDQKATRREMESEAAKLSELRSKLPKAEELIKRGLKVKEFELRKKNFSADGKSSFLLLSAFVSFVARLPFLYGNQFNNYIRQLRLWYRRTY